MSIFWSFLRWLLVGVGVALLPVLGLVGFVLSAYDETFTDEAECGVVFGAAVWRDDIPSDALSDRVLAGIDLYKNEQISCLIFSGGDSTFGAHEVDVMQKMAADAGVLAKDIRLDYDGENTLATLQNLPAEVSSFVMISQDFHLARIGMIARRLGVPEVSLHAAKYRHGRFVKEPYYVAREVGGILYYGLTVWPRPAVSQ